MLQGVFQADPYNVMVSENLILSQDNELLEQVPKGIPLILALAGATDAGALTSQLDSYFFNNSDLQQVIQFNTDMLMDFRSRRPQITFNEDHFEDYEPDELVLSLGHDALGNQFLLLSGFEPDFRWHQFVEMFLNLVDDLEISVTVWAHAIPMPVPHTRPIRSTISGTRQDLIETKSVWKPTTKLPASLSHLIEYRLHTMGENVVGFAMLVPHYLSNNEYPDALLAALDSIMSGTGLIFDTDQVQKDANSFVKQVESQINDNEESVLMLQGLEARYDEYVANQANEAPLVAEGIEIPTADQLASELEKFLAQQRDEKPPTETE